MTLAVCASLGVEEGCLLSSRFCGDADELLWSGRGRECRGHWLRGGQWAVGMLVTEPLWWVEPWR